MKTEGKYQRAVRLGEMTLEEAVVASNPNNKYLANKDGDGTGMFNRGSEADGQYDDTGFFHPFERGTKWGEKVPQELKDRHAAWEARQGKPGNEVMLPSGRWSNDMSGGGNLGQFVSNAAQQLNDHLGNLRGIGTAGLMLPRLAQAMRSATDKMANGVPASPEDELPVGPGNNYMTHLFKKHGLPSKIKAQQKEMMTQGTNIFTDQMEALKLAIKSMGILSDKNPGGLPIELAEAKKIWFGENKVDEIEEAQWRTSIEIGDSKIDPKRVRKFTNYDGSLTWEILNGDKTVMSRFTMGDFKGTKIFSQGGYKKFAELFKQARQKLGKDVAGEFDAIRGMFK